MVCRTMLKLIAILGVFFYGLLLFTAEATPADAGPVVSTVTWDKEFRPIYPEAASYPRATALSDGRVMITFAHPTPVGRVSGSVNQGQSWTAPVHLLGDPDDPANRNPLQVLNDGPVLTLSNHRGKIWVKAGATDGTPGP